MYFFYQDTYKMRADLLATNLMLDLGALSRAISGHKSQFCHLSCRWIGENGQVLERLDF